jgi:hypothetical protein
MRLRCIEYITSLHNVLNSSCHCNDRNHVYDHASHLSNSTVNAPVEGYKLDVFYLGRPIAPSFLGPNAGGGGELRGLSQWVQLYTGAQLHNLWYLLLLVERESVEQWSLVTWSLMYTLYAVYSLTLGQVLQLAKPNQLKIRRCVTLPDQRTNFSNRYLKEKWDWLTLLGTVRPD